jgi:hypothetical protein
MKGLETWTKEITEKGRWLAKVAQEENRSPTNKEFEF